jgi:hypothetical protein
MGSCTVTARAGIVQGIQVRHGLPIRRGDRCTDRDQQGGTALPPPA